MKKLSPHCLDECTFIILGATGDLTKRKLLPAIYKLIEDKKLCRFAIVGVSFDATTAKSILTQAKPFFSKIDPKIWKRLESAFRYHKMDFSDVAAYEQLHDVLVDVEKKENLAGNRIIYFASQPKYFITITKNFVASKIVKKKIKKKRLVWTRLVYEKPFGDNLKSSQTINRYLSRVFDESQIFRIDHYLGKELVGNIALTRFTNRVLEPLWNNEHIDSVHISLSEKICVEGRGAFYDHYGAIKDMVQSHMLQLLALAAMEAPKKLAAQDIRDAKAKVLKNVLVKKVLIGQFDGYKKEPGVRASSKTETFVLVKTLINNRRWKGVPFYLKTGKCLDEKESFIQINFKPVKCLLTACPTVPNSLTIRIFPDEGMALGLNAKIPGISAEVTPIEMDFCHGCLFGPNTPAAYETLLADVMSGDQTTFVRSDEINSSWKIVDKILKIKGTLHSYKKGSSGPTEQNNFK